MKEKLKQYIDQIDDSDTIFISQIYTILKRHIEKKNVALNHEVSS